MNIVHISESSMDIDVQRQVAESSPNKTPTECKPGLYAQPASSMLWNQISLQ